MIHRRSFLTGLGALIAAPAIVHAGNLMAVRGGRLLLQPASILKIYQNRVIREYMDIREIRDRNTLLQVEDFAGAGMFNFRNIPIRTSELPA